MRPLISVIMPAYNSAGNIERALSSVRMQDVTDDIEILVVDGGSSDSTREIAASFGAAVLNNPDRLPEYAKRIGFAAARGEFAVKMDTDEELLNAAQLSRRVAFLRRHPEVKIMLADKLLPARGCGVSCAYLNLCGDPFTLFVYKNTGSVAENFKRNAVSAGSGEYLLRFGENDLRPIGDSGTSMYSMDYINENFSGQKGDLRFAAAATELLIQKTGYCGCIAGDDIRHYSAAALRTYLAKLRFRVINNLFHKEESGFSAREAGSPVMAKRKKLFVLYAATLVGPLWDSIRLAIKHRDASLLLHFFYVYYVCFYIAWCLVGKLMGKSPENKSYGA